MPRTALLALLLAAACSQTEPTPEEPAPGERVEPSVVTVEHVLIAFQGAPRVEATRSREDAKSLAYDLLERARDGADFVALRDEHTDDRSDGAPGGPYTLANHGVPVPPGAFPRSGMVRGFGDVAFSLDVGEVGIADHHLQDSPFGWHVIKRVK